MVSINTALEKELRKDKVIESLAKLISDQVPDFRRAGGGIALSSTENRIKAMVREELKDLS